MHGVFPYLLVKSPTDELRYGEQLAQSLDMAINLAHEKGDTDSKHVYNITLLELMYWEIVWRLDERNIFLVCRPIYGYHSKMVKFWKIEFYNPMIIRKYDVANWREKI